MLSGDTFSVMTVQDIEDPRIFDGICNLKGYNIDLLKGIEKYDKIDYINLSSNYLKTLDCDTCLKNVISLNINSNYLSDISNISELFPNLEILRCSYNLLNSFSGISKLSNLKALLCCTEDYIFYKDISELRHISYIELRHSPENDKEIYILLKNSAMFPQRTDFLKGNSSF